MSGPKKADPPYFKETQKDIVTGRGDPLVVELIEGHAIVGRIVGQSRPFAGGRVIATRADIRLEGRVSEDGFVPTPDAVAAGTTDLVLEWANRP